MKSSSPRQQPRSKRLLPPISLLRNPPSTFEIRHLSDQFLHLLFVNDALKIGSRAAVAAIVAFSVKSLLPGRCFPDTELTWICTDDAAGFGDAGALSGGGFEFAGKDATAVAG
ncbi:MAG: hypothetical protein Q9170_007593, partial [Blastenia crenularia]